MLSIVQRAFAAALTALLLLAAAVVGSGAVLARLDVVRFATVLSGSMEPGISTGSVIAGTPLRSDEVQVGDIVMFAPPAPYGTPGGKPVVHRVTKVADDDGVLEINTAGDANSNPDAWTLDARRTTFYEYRGQSHVLGSFVQLAPAMSRQFLWAVPVLLLVLHVLRRIWRDDAPAARPVRGRRAVNAGARPRPARLLGP